MTGRELALRREVMLAFAATGGPPAVGDQPALRTLAERHVVVLGEAGADGAPRIVMAHPFAGHREGARVDAPGRSWWGNCAWDALGIVAALGLREATIAADGLSLTVRDGDVAGDALFHVAVPARRWWED
ncbi:MAG: hypothetical protein QOG11_397, partial [Solirubrobacteraceae bacterium]|nr:hypothetical protein [Solirubrobacteraceae bacterium]